MNPQPNKPFHIYRSGAGSGKTYTLAKSYLTLALSRGSSFKNVLGVTFTNKATEEMKSRIVSILKALANNAGHPMSKDLCEALEINESELVKRANGVLSDILHQYGRFSIVTIDSFFNQVIRSFAKEMGLQGTFTIDLDQKTVIERVIDRMLMEIGDEDKKQLRGWLTEFAEHRVDEGQTWDFRSDVTKLAGEILKDDFKKHASEILSLSEKPGFFLQMRKELQVVRFQFENEIKNHAKQFNQYLEKEGLSVDVFTYKASGPAGLFDKLVKSIEKGDKIEIPKRSRDAKGEITKWLSKPNLKTGHLNHQLESVIIPLHSDLIDYIDQQMIVYQSAREVLRYLFTFGILAQINRYIQWYRDEHDVMLIADLPDFLHQIINDSDTPFIYEKVGSIFSHYLIDEFQDTSAFQWDNFMPLVKNSTDSEQFSMVVGDVKQSIYRFRGGDWELLQNRVKEDIGDYHAETHNLDVNWRSDPAIIEFNNDFFIRAADFSRSWFADMVTEVQHNTIRGRIEENVQRVFDTFSDVAQRIPESKKESKGSIRLEFIGKDDNEEGWTQEAIERTIRQVEDLQRKGYELRDIAILTRYSREGRDIANAFIDYRNSELADPDLKYEVVSSEALYLTSSHLVRFIVSLIKWLNDEKNTIVLCEWLYEYQHYILNAEVSESDIFSTYDQWEKLVPKAFKEQREYLKTLPLYELVEGIIRLFELNQLQEEFAYLQGFQDAVLDYSKNERGDIASFLEWWEKVRKERAIQISDQNNAIKILTIHKSKGLEFPVVILPFLSWDFDNTSGFNDTILWCEGNVAPSPFNKLPVLPLKYSANLANTYWGEQYYLEKLKTHLDNLNMLYVAFTRPVEVLIGYGKLPSGKSLNAYTLIHKLCADTENWDDATNIFQVGEIPTQQNEAVETIEYGLENYQSSPWRNKVSLQMRGSAELNDEIVIDAAQAGIVMHEQLSKIRYRQDLDRYIGLPVHEDLRAIVDHPELADWFSDDWNVANEVPILLPGGDFKRIDRLNWRENETVVIDFKTGAKRKKDHYQVKDYLKILAQMGYTGIKGYLVYLQDLEVEEVAK